MTSIDPEASRESISTIRSENQEPAAAGSFVSSQKKGLPMWLKGSAVAFGILGAATGGYLISEAQSDETKVEAVGEEHEDVEPTPSSTTAPEEVDQQENNPASEIPQGFETPDELMVRWGYESSLIYYDQPASVNKQEFVLSTQRDWLNRLNSIEQGDPEVEPSIEYLENTTLLFQEVGFGLSEEVIAVHNPIIYGVGLKTEDDGTTRGTYWHLPSQTTHESYAVMFLDQNEKWQCIFMQPDYVGWSTYENLGLVGAFTDYGHTPQLSEGVADYNGSQLLFGPTMNTLSRFKGAREFANLREAIEYNYRNSPDQVPYHDLTSLVSDIRKAQ